MFTALIIATVLDLSLALPPSPAIDPCSAFALRRCLDMPTAKRIGGEGRIRTHGADNRTRLWSSMILMLTCPTLYLSVWSGSLFLSR